MYSWYVTMKGVLPGKVFYEAFAYLVLPNFLIEMKSNQFLPDF